MSLSLQHEQEALNAANERLYQLANHDQLTGLFNRGAFVEHINARSPASWDRHDSFSLLLLDLDGFKPINDTLGHKAGDEVLQQVAERLSRFAAEDRFLARLGGDEFAVLIDLDGAAASEAATEIIRAIGQPITIGSDEIKVGVSIGIASIPNDCASVEELRIRADLALYAAKESGRNRYRHFDMEMLSDFELTRDLERDLSGALSDGSLVIWYQPQVRIGDRALIGIEALIRWRHPKHGWISPPLIIDTARHAHLSAAVTTFVLDNACATLRALVDTGHDDLIMAVNISPAEIEHCAIGELLEEKIASYALEPSRLELEITEDTLITSQTVIKTLNRLSDMGLRLAIDDFGAGCSSISYLRALKVDRIKIDQGFVTGFTARPGDSRLVQMILGIGRSLDIEVVAEGVETLEDAALLLDLGCSVGQGYLFGRAMPRADLDVWLQERIRRDLCQQLFAAPKRGEAERAEQQIKPPERAFTPSIQALTAA